MKKCLVVLAAAVALLYAPASKADNLVGGDTTVALNSSTVSVLTGLGFSISAVSPATLTGLDASFPITSDTYTMGNLTTIDHSGGLAFSKGGTTTDIENFIINLTTDSISGTAIVNGTNDGSVTLFDFNSSLDLTLDSALAGDLTAIYGAPNLTGAAIGTATVNPTPEPSSLALLGTALAGAGVTLRRRFTSN